MLKTSPFQRTVVCTIKTNLKLALHYHHNQLIADHQLPDPQNPPTPEVNPIITFNKPQDTPF